MKLALLHFKRPKPSRHYSCYLYDILKPRVVVELSQLWQTLLTDEKNRDDGKHSRNINDKSLARKRDKAYVQGQSKEALNNQVAALTKQFGLNPAGFALFLTQADDLIEKQFGKGEATYLNAKRLLSDFIAHKNKTTRLKTGYYAVPAAPLSTVSKTNPMRIKEDWVSKGKWITRILKVVLTHWQSVTFYQTVNNHPDNQQTALGWLLFSGIVFGGINDKGMLQGWLITLVLENLKPFIDNRVVANVRYLSQNFGNERDEHGNIYNSQQICVDLISQLWLMSVRQIPNEMRQTLVRQSSLESLFKSTLKPILPAQLKPYGTLDFFLKHASYYWEVMPGVSINQTLVGVLQGVERTTGLQRNDFDNLFFDRFNHPKACYNLTDTSKPSSIKPKDIAEQSLALQAKIRDADLIHEIKTIFRKKYDKTRLGNGKITLTKTVKSRLQIEDLRRLLSTFKHIRDLCTNQRPSLDTNFKLN